MCRHYLLLICIILSSVLQAQNPFLQRDNKKFSFKDIVDYYQLGPTQNPNLTTILDLRDSLVRYQNFYKQEKERLEVTEYRKRYYQSEYSITEYIRDLNEHIRVFYKEKKWDGVKANKIKRKEIYYSMSDHWWCLYLEGVLRKDPSLMDWSLANWNSVNNYESYIDLEKLDFVLEWIEKEASKSIYKTAYRKYQVISNLSQYAGDARTAAYCNKELEWWLSQQKILNSGYRIDKNYPFLKEELQAKELYQKSLKKLGLIFENASQDVDSSSRKAIPMIGIESFLNYDFSKGENNAYRSRLRLFQEQLKGYQEQKSAQYLLESTNFKRIKFMYEKGLQKELKEVLMDHIIYFKLEEKAFPKPLNRDIPYLKIRDKLLDAKEKELFDQQKQIAALEKSDSLLFFHYQNIKNSIVDSTEQKMLSFISSKTKAPINYIAQAHAANIYGQKSYYRNTNLEESKRLYLELLENEDLLNYKVSPYYNRVKGSYTIQLDPETFKEIKVFQFKATNHSLYQQVLIEYLKLHGVGVDAEIGENHKIFKPVNTFIKAKLPKEKTEGLIVAKAFQKILAYQQKQHPQDTSGFIAWEMERMKQMHQISYLESKEALYIKSFQQFFKKYESTSYEMRLGRELVDLYYQLGRPYETEPHRYKHQRYYWKNALDLAQEILKKYPKGDQKGALRKLVKELGKQKLALSAERYVAADRPFKVMAATRNVSAVWVYVFPLKRDKQYQRAYGHDFESRWELMDTNYIQKYKIEGLTQGDLRQNQIELPLKALKAGHYEIRMFYQQHNGKVQKEKICISVSDLLMVKVPMQDSINYYLMDRTKGQALADVQLWAYQVVGDSLKDRKLNTYDPVTFEDITKIVQDTVLVYDWRRIGETNKNGLFKVGRKGRAVYDEDGSFLRNKAFISNLKFINQQDTFWLDEEVSTSYNYYSREQPVVKKTHFFTDRSIYQPGQTIHFKGILTNGLGQVFGDSLDGKSLKAKDAFELIASVQLLDNRAEVLDSVVCIVNAFGSFSDHFTIPEYGSTGNYSIKLKSLLETAGNRAVELKEYSKNASKSIKVENYKRPTFEVRMDPITEYYNLTDEARVSGKAKAYAGYPISNAKVRYTIQKRAVHPYIWRPWRPVPKYAVAQIATARVIEAQDIGETTTDEGGNFKISFKGSLDDDHKKGTEYFYTIKVELVDAISGETQTAETKVEMSAQALKINMSLAEEVYKNESLQIPIEVYKTSGIQEDYPTQLRIYKLKAPKIPKHYAIWERPTLFLLSEKEHNQHFPYYPYDMEYEFRMWERGELIEDAKFSSKEITNYTLKDLAEGDYLAELLVFDQKNQDTLRIEKRFKCFDLSSKDCKVSVPIWTKLDQTRTYIGDSLKFQFASAKPETYVLLRIEQSDKLLYEKWLKVEGKLIHKVSVTNAFKGDVHYYVDAVMDNRKYQLDGAIKVDYSPLKMNISYSSFRDKLLPGQKEKWKLKIEDQYGNPMQAELVATLYDASLDVLKRHRFQMSNPFLCYQRHSLLLNWHKLFEHEYSKGAYTYSYDTILAFDPESFEENVSVVVNEIAPQKMVKEMERLEYKANALESRRMLKSAMPAPVMIRKNLAENVFFLPHLKTNAKGEIEIPFVMNEALTKWRLLVFAHTKNMEFAVSEKTVVTQKKMMVQPNLPRFARVGDELNFKIKLSNLSTEALEGKAKFEILDPETMKPIKCYMPKVKKKIRFEVDSMRSAELSWSIKIPEGYTELVYRIVAKSKSYSDGEQGRFSILPNEMVAVQSKSVFVNAGGKLEYNLNNFKNNDRQKIESYSLELSTNPAWDALRSLPYLMDYPYECSEQLLNRYYSNTLASAVLNESPKIQEIFEKWRKEGLSKSKLLQNQEFKAILLEESPWLAAATGEAEIKKRLGLLFDLDAMQLMKQNALRKLVNRQNMNGGFGWFNGGRPNRYISQYVVEHLGHLDRLTQGRAITEEEEDLMEEAQDYTDGLVQKEYQNFMGYIQEMGVDSNSFKLGRLQIHYLYARSFQPLEDSLTSTAYNFVLEQAWRKHQDFAQNDYITGMIALALHRQGRKAEALLLADSLKARAIRQGGQLFWQRENGYYWYQAKMETQALMIELFTELELDKKDIQAMKVWILQNKTENYWSSTKGTAAATYALLLGDNWLEDGQLPQIKLDGKKLALKQEDMEAGTGHFKKQFEAADTKTIHIANQNESVPMMGSIFQTYSSPIDAISVELDTNKTHLKQRWYKVINTTEGDSLLLVSDQPKLELGDKVRVVLSFHAKESLEFVQIKSQHPSGFEPKDQLSAYQSKYGLYYYKANSKAATNFFFEYLPKGKHELSYDMFVNQAGQYQSGYGMLQSMYAPEHTVYDKSQKLKAE